MQNINLILRLSLKDAILAGSDAWGEEFVEVKPSQLTGRQRIALAALPTLPEEPWPVLNVAYPAKPEDIPGLLDRLSSPNMEDIADPEPMSMDPEPMSMDPKDRAPESDTDD